MAHFVYYSVKSVHPVTEYVTSRMDVDDGSDIELVDKFCYLRQRVEHSRWC